MDWTTLLVAFGGGVFGAAFGGLNSFILVGLSATFGTGIFMATGDPNFNNLVTWGPFLAPNVAFCGGMAAAAFANKQHLLPSGKDTSTALLGINSPQALVIGGIFGVIGYGLKILFDLMPEVNQLPWTNTMAMAININSFLIRFIFGRTGLFGQVPLSGNRWAKNDSDEWDPWHFGPIQLILLSLAIGLPAAYISKLFPASVSLIFGLVSFSLIFYHFGAKIPVTHHIALSAEFVAALSGNIWWGLAAALLAAFLGELFASLFLNYGDTHIDPPALALVVIYSIVPILGIAISGSQSLILPISICFLIGLTGFLLLNSLHKPDSSD